MRIATPSTRLTRLVQRATAACTLLLSGAASAQTAVDSALLSYINGIRAIDVHAHPMRPVAANAPPDTEFDALPLDGIPAFAVPHRLTTDDPIWREAQTALYKVPAAASDSAYRGALGATVERTRREQGERFPVWTLDAAVPAPEQEEEDETR